MKTKLCGTCKVIKKISEFPKNKSKLDGHDYSCKGCKKIYFKEWYKNNKKLHIARVAKTRAVYHKKITDFITKYILTHHCVDCGENRMACLDFDHIKGKKINTVSQMIGNGHSLNSIKKEIAKCEVRCANCHRIKTAKDQNWYKKW